eukprot:1418425-Rhodomonas_salina.5
MGPPTTTATTAHSTTSMSSCPIPRSLRPGSTRRKASKPNETILWSRPSRTVLTEAARESYRRPACDGLCGVLTRGAQVPLPDGVGGGVPGLGGDAERGGEGGAAAGGQAEPVEEGAGEGAEVPALA